MYIVHHDRIVINGISFFEPVGLPAVTDFDAAFQYVNKFFTFVGGEFVV
jgi:hypothetical protein